jgi:two-component system sensor histidine kinase ChvG
MASDTVIARPEPRRLRRFWPGSRLGRLIIGLNLLGLTILIAGALILNELRRGLVQARIDSLTTQGELIANVIGGAATRGAPEPALEADKASEILQLLFIPRSQRARLFDMKGRQLADSYLVGDRVEQRPLPPARRPGSAPVRWRLGGGPLKPEDVVAARAALTREVDRALHGYKVAGVRRTQTGERVVSVSIPVQRVQAVLGVLTLEAGDVDKIIAAQRVALLPFILVAVGVNLFLLSFLFTWLVARPVMQLARAADRVRLSRAREISLPSLAKRNDELGDLTRSLQAMTAALSERMDAIERFAADVAHEIRNPLTSVRSAVETLRIVKDSAARERLLKILVQDVSRLDRLMTDISNASRLDAELSRDAPRMLDLGRLLSDLVALRQEAAAAGSVQVTFDGPSGVEPIPVQGREGPLGQVFRNLIENASSFSPPGAVVRVSLARAGDQARVTVEDEGPGVPAENLETVFERFYTSRPAGAAFGGHSGLGLSIARQIVEAHGGRIWAENRTDADGQILGARFTVSLPLARP